MVRCVFSVCELNCVSTFLHPCTAVRWVQLNLVSNLL